MKRIVPFAIGLMLIGLLVVFNKKFNNGVIPDPDQPPPPAASQPQKSAPPPATPPDKNALPNELVLGNPQTAKYKITFGYAYDEAAQANPAALTQTLNAVRAAQAGRADVSAVVADVDVPVADRTPVAQGIGGEGLFVNGTPTDPAKLSAALKP